MNYIPLTNLSLVIFDKNNPEHVRFLKYLVKDKTILARFQGITNNLLHNHGDEFFDRSFFVSNEIGGGVLIGFINIGAFNEREKSVYLRAAIDIKTRGAGYGKQLLREVTDYIFNNYHQVESIRLKIASDNKASLGTANACGYKWLSDDFYAAYNPNLNNSKPEVR